MTLFIASSMFVVIIIMISIPGHCQDPERQADIARTAEDLVGTSDDDESFEASYEALMQMLSQPLNLNENRIQTLQALGVLTQDQIQNILEYRARYGDLVSVYELQAVPGLSLEVIEKLRPFVTVTQPTASIDRKLIRRIKTESDNYLIMRFSQAWSEVEEPTTYTGSPEHLLIRFRSQRPGDFSFGFNTEKDSGEPIKWDVKNKYYGFDRWSFHAQIQNKGFIKNLIVGDLQAQFGQGLVFGGAFGPGKGAETITTMRRAHVGILPYTSAYEAGNMRGIGVSMSLPKKLELTVLYSRARRDASREDLLGETVVRSLPKSGLHRTRNELLARQQVADTQLGVVVMRRQGALEAGLTFDHSKFENAIEPEATPYNQYAFKGRTLTHAGVFFSYNIGRFATFGEMATIPGRGTGLIAGVLGSITQHLDVAFLIRSYARDFQSRFANAMSENSTPTNERGIYLGWRYQFNRKLSLTGYVDLFTFPWLRYRAYSPSYGHELLCRFSFQPSRNVLLFIQGRHESKSRNSAVDQQTYTQAEGVKSNCWVHAETGLREHVRIRTKLQLSRYAGDGITTHGVALSQDLCLKINKYQFIARYALFDTDSYDNRLYSYENDVLFAYSMPAYNGTGIRKMAMLQYNISRGLTVWARYAETTTVVPESLARGPASKRYALDREVRFQLRIQF